MKARHTILHTSIALIVLLASCASPTVPPVKPNIIVFYVDDLGYSDVGCYGAGGVVTPNIDSLAHQGIRFTDAHCGAATCARASWAHATRIGCGGRRTKASVASDIFREV